MVKPWKNWERSFSAVLVCILLLAVVLRILGLITTNATIGILFICVGCYEAALAHHDTYRKNWQWLLRISCMLLVIGGLCWIVYGFEVGLIIVFPFSMIQWAASIFGVTPQHASPLDVTLVLSDSAKSKFGLPLDSGQPEDVLKFTLTGVEKKQRPVARCFRKLFDQGNRVILAVLDTSPHSFIARATPKEAKFIVSSMENCGVQVSIENVQQPSK